MIHRCTWCQYKENIPGTNKVKCNLLPEEQREEVANKVAEGKEPVVIYENSMFFKINSEVVKAKQCR